MFAANLWIGQSSVGWWMVTSLVLAGVGAGYWVARGNLAWAGRPVRPAPEPLAETGVTGRDLENIAWTLRKNLARHQASVINFRKQLEELDAAQREAAWQRICHEADELLAPTLQLVNRIGAAYEQLRQRTNHLMATSEVRRDPLTGLGNRRSLDQSLTVQFSLLSRYEQRFCVAVFDADHFSQVGQRNGHAHGDQMLQTLAGLLQESIRETDLAFRYAGEAFLVLMPSTELEGACHSADRWRCLVAERMVLTVSAGVTVVLDGDTPDSVLARADVALYQAKSSGRNCVCWHDGEKVELVPATRAAELRDGSPTNSQN